MVSRIATGESLIGVTLMSKVDVEISVPSVAVYVIVVTSPLKFVAGVNV